MYATHAPTTSSSRVRRAHNRSDRAHNARAAVTAYHHELAEVEHEAYVEWMDELHDQRWEARGFVRTVATVVNSRTGAIVTRITCPDYDDAVKLVESVLERLTDGTARWVDEYTTLTAGDYEGWTRPA